MAGLDLSTHKASKQSGEAIQEMPSKDLCSVCARTDWMRLGLHTREPTSPARRFRSPGQSKSACTLCQMLTLTSNEQNMQTVSANLASTYFYRDELVSISERASGGPSSPDFATVLIPDNVAGSTSALLGISCPNMPKQKFAPRLINPFSVDYSLLQEWLIACSAHASSECSMNKSTNLWGFRLILCQARKVVQAPRGSPYVALSYVWGDQEDPPSSGESGDFPQTVSDSMTVALTLGFEYLCK